MRKYTGVFAILLFIFAVSADAITVDELIEKHIQARGGIEKIKAIQTIRATGKIRFGSTEVLFLSLAKRPGMLRNEVSLQGLTAVDAYDGTGGWRISPFEGRMDPEKISEDEAKSLQMEADLEGPLVDYKAKGHTVEYQGTEDVDGTDAHKIKVSYKNGNTRTIYLDPDYFLEIRYITQIRIRGAQEESETDLGNYEKIDGVYFPFSIEVGEKGQPKGQKVVIEKVELNTNIDDNLFHFPVPKK